MLHKLITIQNHYRLQIVVAVLMTSILVFPLMPSIDALLFLPFGLAFIVCAIRSSKKNRWARRLSFFITLLLALLFTLSIAGSLSSQGAHFKSENGSYIRIAGDGEIEVLDRIPDDMHSALRGDNVPKRRGPTFMLGIMIATTFLAWIAILMKLILRSRTPS